MSRAMSPAMTWEPPASDVRIDVPPLVVRRGNVIRLIDPRTILRITGAGNYARLHTESGTHLVRETLVSLEERLGPLGFVRVHRSVLVRVSGIREFRAGPERVFAVMADGGEVRMSKAGRSRLNRVLGVRL